MMVLYWIVMLSVVYHCAVLSCILLHDIVHTCIVRCVVWWLVVSLHGCVWCWLLCYDIVLHDMMMYVVCIVLCDPACNCIILCCSVFVLYVIVLVACMVWYWRVGLRVHVPSCVGVLRCVAMVCVVMYLHASPLHVCVVWYSVE